jgi:serine/threonine protein kinase
LPHPQRIYLLDREDAKQNALTAWDRPLHPLLIYNPDRDEVAFLNGRRGKREAEYLCYNSGAMAREGLDADQRELLIRVLGTPVDDAEVSAWAAASQAEEAPVEERPEASKERRRLGEFELLSRIGQGGMGVVYRAWQPSLNRQVALKVMLRSGDAKSESRFSREIRALGRVEHPHLVKIYTSGSESDQWYYTMELIEGVDLAQIIEELADSDASQIDETAWNAALTTAFDHARSSEELLSAGVPEDDEFFAKAHDTSRKAKHLLATPAHRGQGHIEQVAEIVRQTALAAQALHDAGVVHRDVKPGNIMLIGDHCQAVLMDLGLAQIRDEIDGRLTETTQFVGTRRYASPEQDVSAGHVDHRSDVYSLGVTFWELLTLRPMWDANDNTPLAELLLKIRTSEPERPRKFNPRIPADLEAIVLKCLEKDRDRRYQTAAELEQDIARWQSGEPVLAQPVTVRYVLGKYIRRHRIRVAAISGAVMLLLGLAVTTFVLVDRARREAIQQRLRAEQNLVVAREAVDTMLTEVGKEELANIPQMESTRSELLSRARSFYERFIREEQKDPHLRLEAAVSWKRVADVDHLMGAYDKAKTSYEESIRQLQELVDEHPDEVDFQRQLAITLDSFGRMLSHEDLDAAEQMFDQAIQIQSELASHLADVPHARHELAQSLNDRGSLLLSKNRLEEACADYRLAIETLQELVRTDGQSPDGARYQQELARCLNNLANTVKMQGDKDEAADCYQQAITAMESLHQRDPEQREYRRELASYYNNLANLHYSQRAFEEALVPSSRALDILQDLAKPLPEIRSELGNATHSYALTLLEKSEYELAETTFSQARQIFEMLVEDFPDEALHHDRLGNALSGLGKLEHGRGQPDESKRWVQQAIERHRKALQLAPESPQIARHLLNDYTGLGVVLFSQKDHAALVKMLDSVPSDLAGHPTELFDAAKLVGSIISLLGQSNDMEDSVKQRWAAQYGAAAIALIEAAVDSGFRDGEQLTRLAQEGQPFFSIQNSPVFQKVLAQIQSG